MPWSFMYGEMKKTSDERKSNRKPADSEQQKTK